ncbi:MAG: NYN domain-containing protein [Phycisphaerales bacterium]
MLILDTYNALHAIEGLGAEAASLDVPALARLIAASRYAGARCLLVCDGNQGPSGPIEGAPGVDALYAGKGKDADSLIESILATHSAARNALVVSSDRRVQRAAELARGKWIASPAFLAQILKDAETRKPERPALTPQDEAEIMRAFGIEPEEIERRRRGHEPTGDATLDEAIEHFGTRIDPDELDMSRWLDGEDS